MTLKSLAIGKNAPAGWGMAAIAVTPKDWWYEKMNCQVEKAKARGGSAFVVTTEGDERILPLAEPVFWAPDAPEKSGEERDGGVGKKTEIRVVRTI